MKKFTPNVKLVVLSIALLSLGLFSGCKKCVTCTEANTGVSSEYCGTSSQVNDFEDELKKQGAQYGQDWSCVAK